MLVGISHLSERERQLLRFIVALQDQGKPFPTYAAMAAYMNTGQRNISDLLRRLAAIGFIERSPTGPRLIPERFAA